MDRLTILRRERWTDRVGALKKAPIGHLTQPISRRDHRAEATNGTAGWAGQEPMSLFSQERQWKGRTCRGHCV